MDLGPWHLVGACAALLLYFCMRGIDRLSVTLEEPREPEVAQEVPPPAPPTSPEPAHPRVPEPAHPRVSKPPRHAKPREDVTCIETPVGRRVAELIAEKLQVNVVDLMAETSIVDDLGADSLEQADILFALEDEFGITEAEYDTDEALGLKTVADITRYIQKRVGTGSVH